MKKKLPFLSSKVNPVIIEMLHDICKSAKERNTPFFIEFQTDPNNDFRLAFNMVKHNGFGEINCENKLQMLNDFKVGFEM